MPLVGVALVQARQIERKLDLLNGRCHVGDAHRAQRDEVSERKPPMIF